MAVFVESAWKGRVVWTGVVPDRGAGLESQVRPGLTLSLAGPEGEAHGGLTRPSCSRVKMIHPKDTEIANTRQLSVLSAEELAQIAVNMGIERLDPALVGASLVIEGIPDLSHLPPSSRLLGPDGTTLVVDVENLPCMLPAKPIEKAHPGFGAAFKRAAVGLRGFVGWVERGGTLREGDQIRLFVPGQRGWSPR